MKKVIENIKKHKGDISSVLSLICFCMIYLPYMITTIKLMTPSEASGGSDNGGGWFIIIVGMLIFLPTVIIFGATIKSVKAYINEKNKNAIRNILTMLNIISIILMAPFVFGPVILWIFVLYEGIKIGNVLSWCIIIGAILFCLLYTYLKKIIKKN